MANELRHSDVGTALSKSEWEAVGGHAFDSQAAGDILYASTTSQLSRLGIGTANQILQTNSGASAPEWTTNLTVGSTVVSDDSIVMTPSASDTVTIAAATNGILNITTVDAAGTAADVNIDADGEIVIDPADAAGTIFKIAGTAQLSVVDGSITPTSNNDIDLGTASYQFKNAYIDGTLEADAITIGGTNVVTGSLVTTLGTISAGTWQGDAIASTYIAGDAITGAKIADDAIGSEHIADDAVVTAAIADDAITSALIADDAVVTAAIADDAITSALIADDAVVSAAIADDAIISALIADDAITSALIADGAVTTALIGTDAVTNAKIADDAINSEQYVDGSIDTAHIADDQVTLAKMAGLTRGSIIYGNASGNPAALGVGNANYVIKSDGTDIAWAAQTDTTYTGGDGLTLTGTDFDLDSALTTVASIYKSDLALGYGASHANINFATDNNIIFDIDGTAQIKLQDGVFTPETDSDIDLGTSSVYFANAYIDTITTTGDVDVLGNIELGHATDTTIARSAGGTVTIQGSVIKTAGTENIWVPAAAMSPRDNAGCAGIATVAAGTNGRPDFRVLDFDNSSDEHAQFTIAMPKSWDGGNIYYTVYWIGIAATTGVTWGLQVLSLNDNEEFDQAYGTAVMVDDDSQGDVTELLISAKSAAIACSGADNDLLCFQVYRDVSAGNDDMAGDARLWGLLLEYTTDAATDA